MSSPTSRSLAHYRKQGGIVGIVERYNSVIKQRFDLWGFADLIHCEGDIVTLVQTTSRANLNARVAKVNASKEAAYWLSGKNHRIVCHGWKKSGPRGKRKFWTLDEVEIKASPFLDMEAKQQITP